MIDPTRLFDLTGKTALVTGGATGLGRTAAEALLAAGARVLIASRKGDACIAVAQELSAIGPCEGFAGDVGTEAGVDALAAEVAARTDRLDILINNAGATWGEPFGTHGFKAFDRVLSVNVTGLFTLTQRLMPMLTAAGTADDPARIVNIGSVMGTMPIADGAYSYAASKAAVHHLTRILANEFSGRHVTTNAIAPGPFETRMTRYSLGDDAGKSAASAVVPMGRIGCEDDLAGTVLFLTGRGGAYVSGAIVPLDGGISARAPLHMFREDDA